MPIALLKTNFSQSSVDADKGVIYGVRVMEIGKVARFNTVGAGVKSVKIGPRHIDALMSHAGNRSITMHLTHDWLDAKREKNGDTEEMKARIGALKNFRKDNNGNLIADAYLMAGQHRDGILWAAEHDTDNNMLSAVFAFAKDDPDCLPINFQAADLVSCGAGTTALLSEAQENNTMPLEPKELIALLGDEEVKTALLALIPKPNPEEATAALKKSIDEAVTAALANHKTAMSDDDKTEIAKLAEASIVANIGSLPAIKNLTDKKNELTATAKFNGLVKELTEKGVPEGAAIVAVMKNHEAEYAAMQVEKGIFKAAK